jgi:peptide/nickel transport system substrate-binding protein
MPGLLWSDGTPLTAADSVYSFEISISPDVPNPSRYTQDRTASYEATDDVTTVWTGLPGFFDSTYMLHFFTPQPQHVMGQYTPADLVTNFDAQGLWVGWGAYIIDEYTPGQQMTLHKNPNYFRAGEGLPKFDNLVFRFVGADANADIAAVLAGECDVIDQTASLDSQSQLLLQLQAKGQINATFVTGTTWEHVDFDIRPVESTWNTGVFAGWVPSGSVEGPFGDVRLRQALAMCMDRQAVVDTVTYGQSIVIDTYLPPNHPMFAADAKHWDFDPAAAGVLFDEIGWLDDDADPATPRVAKGVTGVPDGTKLSMNYETTTAAYRAQVTQILQQSLADCGVEAILGYHPASEWFADPPDARLAGHQFDLGEFAWLTGVEPACDLYLSTQYATEANGWAGQNYGGYENPEYDKVCNAAIQSLPGEEAYAANHIQAQLIFAEDLPVIPLFLRLKLAATRPDMCNFIMDPTANSEMWNIEAFDYGEGCK